MAALRLLPSLDPVTGQVHPDAVAEEVVDGQYSFIKAAPLQTVFSRDGGNGGSSPVVVLLLVMVSAALAIIIIALLFLISKMRRRHNDDATDAALDDMPPDPYLQAIMFPSEPRPEWHKQLRHVIHKAGQKMFGKPEPHQTTIPENLRHQLKHIYVY